MGSEIQVIKKSRTGKSAKAKTIEAPRDAKKEGVYRTLSQILGSAGHQVRREELRRGPGWRAMSGSCRMKDDSLILVDRRLPQDEQLDFLVDRLLELKCCVPQENFDRLPKPIANRLQPLLAA
jgi:hypothetical protein